MSMLKWVMGTGRERKTPICSACDFECERWPDCGCTQIYIWDLDAAAGVPYLDTR